MITGKREEEEWRSCLCEGPVSTGWGREGRRGFWGSLNIRTIRDDGYLYLSTWVLTDPIPGAVTLTESSEWGTERLALLHFIQHWSNIWGDHKQQQQQRKEGNDLVSLYMVSKYLTWLCTLFALLLPDYTLKGLKIKRYWNNYFVEWFSLDPKTRFRYETAYDDALLVFHTGSRNSLPEWSRFGLFLFSALFLHYLVLFVCALMFSVLFSLSVDASVLPLLWKQMMSFIGHLSG